MAERFKPTSRVKAEGENTILVLRRQDLIKEGILGWNIDGQFLATKHVLSVVRKITEGEDPYIFYIKNASNQLELRKYPHSIVCLIRG